MLVLQISPSLPCVYAFYRIREAIEIHCQAPKLNRDIGYELPAIYRDVLSRDIFST